MFFVNRTCKKLAITAFVCPSLIIYGVYTLLIEKIHSRLTAHSYRSLAKNGNILEICIEYGGVLGKFPNFQSYIYFEIYFFFVVGIFSIILHFF